MATQDLSRNVFDPRMNHRGVRGQTGRVITDEDISAIDDLAAEERRSDRLGIIGAHGTSNDGFRISDVRDMGGNVEFEIAAGDYWIGGLRASLAEGQTFRLQKDWLQRPDSAAPGGARTDLAVLEVWHQTVSAVEDEALFEPALGGPDTTARTRVMSRVRLIEGLTGNDCHELWTRAQTRLRNDGQGEIAPDHELAGDGRLTVGFTNVGATSDLCSPSVAQGFLGAANRAIRVQMVTPTAFCWGFENAGRLMRAVVVDDTTLRLLSEPRDEAHWPAPNQVVQVLPWGAVQENGEKLADELGDTHFSLVDAAFDPDDQTLTLADALPANFGLAWQGRDDAADLKSTRFGEKAHDDLYVFVRVWDRGEDRSDPALIPVAPGVVLGTTGLTVTFHGTMLRPGDSWEIAARPHAPDEVAPWDLMTTRPYGQYRRYMAPLAQIRWNGTDTATAIDCRMRFRPLTRMNDCVTLRVGDGTSSHGDYRTIQAAVKALPEGGGRILVLPGTYDGRVEIHGRRDIRIEGCGERTTILAPDKDDMAIVRISSSARIELRDMRIISPFQLGVLAGRGDKGRRGCEDIRIDNLAIEHFQRGAIAYADVSRGHVRGCRLECRGEFDPRTPESEVINRPSVFLQGDDLALCDSALTGISRKPLSTALGGVQIGGGSARIRVCGNRIGGCYGNGITLGSVSWVTARVEADVKELEKHYQTNAGVAQVYHGFWLTLDNCFGIDPERPPKDPQTGDELVPVSDGPLERIHIEENEIQGMGGGGIAVAKYFNLEVTPEFITVEDLTILRNRITGNLVGENKPFPADYNAVAAWGGIMLGDVSRAEIRENTISDNGRTHNLATTGIFALFAEDFHVTGNRILNNGLRANEMDGVPAGWRGGVVIGQVRPAPLLDADDKPIDDDEGLRTDGGQALRITDNTIVAPQGRAVSAFGLGPMAVTGNRLTTQSGGMNGWLVAAAGLKTRTLSLGALLASSLVIALREGARPNMLSGQAILSALGGEVVALGNSGFSSELYLQGLGLSQALVEGEDEAFDYGGDLMTGGDVMLNGNQIRMDGLDGQTSLSISAIALLSLDNVMVSSNQVSLDLQINDFVAINLLSLGWSVHVSDNRFKEPVLNNFASALTVGLMNTTAMNQATHCVLAYGHTDALIDRGNTELIELAFDFDDNAGICDRMRAGLGKMDLTFMQKG